MEQEKEIIIDDGELGYLVGDEIDEVIEEYNKLTE